MNNKNLPFILLTLSAFIALIVPVLLQDGMFMDGVQYSCVSKNMAFGKGTFWQPFFNQTWWKSDSNVFLEQPPLGIWIQSLFFRIFGDSMYVERFYIFMAALVNAFFIIRIWKLIFKNSEERKKMYWIPVLFWITIPLCFWTFQNNMLENTMGAFTLGAVYFSLRAVLIDKQKFINLFFSGLFIFFATMTKGLPGLFPIVTIPVYWLFFKNSSFLKAFLYSACIICIPVAIYSLLLLNHEASQSLNFYFFERLLNRVNDEPTTTSRFATLIRVCTELLPIIVIVLITFFFSKIKKQNSFSEKSLNKLGLFFIVIGLSATLPLMLTMVQKGFYFVPALPFFAIGFSVIISKSLSGLIEKINIQNISFKASIIISVLILCASIVLSASSIGGTSRDKKILNDVYLFGKLIPQGSVVKTDPVVYDDWAFQCYMYRYFEISITPSDKFPAQYWITEKDRKPSDTTTTKIDLPTEKYELFKIEK